MNADGECGGAPTADSWFSYYPGAVTRQYGQTKGGSPARVLFPHHLFCRAIRPNMYGFNDAFGPPVKASCAFGPVAPVITIASARVAPAFHLAICFLALAWRFPFFPIPDRGWVEVVCSSSGSGDRSRSQRGVACGLLARRCRALCAKSKIAKI